MIYIASKPEYQHGRMVSISQRPPQLKINSLKFFRPSKALMESWNGRNTDEVLDQFIGELDENCAAVNSSIMEWLGRNMHRDTTLLCWEPSDALCYRFPVAQLIEDLTPRFWGGIDVKPEQSQVQKLVQECRSIGKNVRCDRITTTERGFFLYELRVNRKILGQYTYSGVLTAIVKQLKGWK